MIQRKTLVDVQLSDFPQRVRRGSGHPNLKRLPTWDELYLAVRTAVESYKEPSFNFGHGTVPLPLDGSIRGRCTLYADVTRAFLNDLFTLPTGTAIGRVKIKCIDDPQQIASFPGPDAELDIASGDYHAWTAFSYLGETYFIDMSYHCFVDKYPMLGGPKDYFVSTIKRLIEAGIAYDANPLLEEKFGFNERDRYQYSEQLLKSVFDLLPS